MTPSGKQRRAMRNSAAKDAKRASCVFFLSVLLAFFPAGLPTAAGRLGTLLGLGVRSLPDYDGSSSRSSSRSR